MRDNVEPLLGHRRVNEITAGGVEKSVVDVTADKTARDVIVGPRRGLIVRGIATHCLMAALDGGQARCAATGGCAGAQAR
jgi:hypothetical protein